VIVSAVVRSYNTHEIVAGLILRTLPGWVGEASYSLQWDGSPFEPGYYYIEATLQDRGGNTLDSETILFRLGIQGGEITSFTATPPTFSVGDEISISMTFVNTGTTPITGTAVIQVQNEAGVVVQEFQQDIMDLAAGNSTVLYDAWNTTGVLGRTYRIIGVVTYDGMTSDPKIAIVSTETFNYLPLIVRR